MKRTVCFLFLFNFDYLVVLNFMRSLNINFWMCYSFWVSFILSFSESKGMSLKNENKNSLKKMKLMNNTKYISTDKMLYITLFYKTFYLSRFYSFFSFQFWTQIVQINNIQYQQKWNKNTNETIKKKKMKWNNFKKHK